jgi:hypothetical protein
MAARRVIDVLRKLYPHLTWRYDSKLSRWTSPEFSVHSVSTSYDEVSETHVIKYVRSDTNEFVNVPSRFEKL